MLRIANAPVSWGVFAADAPTNPPWIRVIDEIAQAGYGWLELGPIGFLPEDRDAIRAELERRELRVSGTFLYEDLHNPSRRDQIAATAHRIGRLLAALDARYLVIIDAMAQSRMATAGRPAAAVRLDEQRWHTLVSALHEAAAIVSTEYGLTAVFHPHVGTYVEFEDEIDRLLADTNGNLVKLCIDTGHSAYAGVDPVELYRRYADRTAYFHFKDVDGEVLERVVRGAFGFEEAVAEGVFCPLGQGVVDLRALGVELERRGFDGWATVEQDIDPAGSTNPLAAARASLSYLREIGLGGVS